MEYFTIFEKKWELLRRLSLPPSVGDRQRQIEY
jgi:hypothetical protein